MKWLVLVLALTAVVASGRCAQACPTALLVGILAEHAGELVVIPEGQTTAERVNWPSGYGIRPDGDTLVVTDVFGREVAREGDTVHLGGGETTQSGTFDVCGHIEVD